MTANLASARTRQERKLKIKHEHHNPRSKQRMLIVLGVIAVSLLAVLVVPRRGAALVSYRGKTLESWSLQVYANDQNAVGEANAALKALGPRAVPGLVHQLRRRDSKLRRAAFTLAQKMPSGLRQLMLRHIEAPPGPFSRMAAARSLGIIGPEAKAAIPAVVRALGDREGQVCFEATLALARIGKDSVPALVTALGDSNPLVRQAARSSLNLLGPEAEAAVPALISQLRRGTTEDRAGAASILPRIGAPVVPPLLSVLADEQGAIRERAASILVRCYTPPEPGPRARARLPNDHAPAARKAGLERLMAARAADRLVFDVLLLALSDPNEEVHIAALKALCEAPETSQGAVVRLSAGLRDESPRVREWSARALGAMGPAARGALSNLMRLSARETNAAVRAAEQEAAKKILGGNVSPPQD